MGEFGVSQADKEAAECLSWGGSQQVGLVGTGAPVTASSHSSQVASYSVLLRWVVSFHGIVFLLLLVRDLSLNSQAVAQSARLYGNGTCTCQVSQHLFFLGNVVPKRIARI